MEPSLLNRQIAKRPDKCSFKGRILFLTEDPELIRRQLAGEDLPWDTKNPQNNPKLRDDISTDEITPAHICFFFDETGDTSATSTASPCPRRGGAISVQGKNVRSAPGCPSASA